MNTKNTLISSALNDAKFISLCIAEESMSSIWKFIAVINLNRMYKEGIKMAIQRLNTNSNRDFFCLFYQFSSSESMILFVLIDFAERYID